MNCSEQNIVVEEANKLWAESLHDNFFDADPTIEKIVVRNNRYQKRGVQLRRGRLSLSSESKIRYCVSDENLIVCSLQNGEIHVYDMESQELLSALEGIHECYYYAQLSISEQFIVGVTISGEIFIWEKNHFKLIHKDDHSHIVGINGVKIVGKILVTGDSKGLMNVFNISHEKVTNVSKKQFELSISHIDFDGTFVLIGSSSSLILLSLHDFETLKEIKDIETGFVCVCVLSFPFAVTTDSGPGAKIWDLRTGILSKTILKSCSFFKMDLNNGILALSQYSSHLDTCQTFLVDMISIENGVDDIKVKKFEEQLITNQIEEITCVSLSDFNLIQSCGNEILIKNFKMCWDSTVDNLKNIEQEEIEKKKNNLFTRCSRKNRKISFY